MYIPFSENKVNSAFLHVLFHFSYLFFLSRVLGMYDTFFFHVYWVCMAPYISTSSRNVKYVWNAE